MTGGQETSEPQPAPPAARRVRRALLWTGALALTWLFGVWPPPAWWRTHWPAKTAMMRWADGRTSGPPTALDEISSHLRDAVIVGEDSRFWTHHGVDWTELRDALGIREGAGVWDVAGGIWRRRSHLRGASTITQQVAKNLYLSPSRNPLRKVKEAVTAFRLELALPKERILELYLNVAEWGPGVWGAEQASRVYFGVAASGLTEWQAAALAATLPFPRSSNPSHRPERMAARQQLILARLHGADVVVPPEPEEFALPPIPLPAIDTLRIPDSLPALPSDTISLTGRTERRGPRLINQP